MSKLLIRPRKVVKPKKQWDVIETWSSDFWTSVAAENWAQKTALIVTNSSRVSTTGASITSPSTTLRVKHVVIDIAMPIVDPSVMIRAAIIFFPEGHSYSINGNMNVSHEMLTTQHPEWVMDVKSASMNEGGGNLCIHLNSGRLQRKLKSGDSIRLAIAVINPSATQTGYLRYTAAIRCAVSTN